jgi:malonyl-CoA/methylmalonyl-CoA synthetase
MTTALLHVSAADRGRTAIADPSGSYLYGRLDTDAWRVAHALLGDRQRLATRVAYLVTPGYQYAIVQEGVWRAGGVAVPLALSHPRPELEYVLRDTAADIVVCDAPSRERLGNLPAEVGARFMMVEELLEGPSVVRDSNVCPSDAALIIYTSGTTGKPKGVVSTHANLVAQVGSLVTAWEWSAADRLLLVLPLHHIHGILNGLRSALATKALCEIHPHFDVDHTWSRLASGEITVFTAVPTMYQRLITAWDAASADDRSRFSAGSAAARVMMSGSAALPVSVLQRWREIAGHTLLERYGMTEIGMALSNPLRGDRRPGFVGVPLPGVEVRLVGEDGTCVDNGWPGELEVSGPSVFKEYWRRPDETQAAFRAGYFRTGDMAVLEDGMYRLLGRTNLDIIKTGGFKVSAVEIENTLREHAAIVACAVVGMPSAEWGETVAAAVELRGGASLALPELQEWARARLAPYKIPRDLLIVTALPQNVMGKTIKSEVRRLFQPV